MYADLRLANLLKSSVIMIGIVVATLFVSTIAAAAPVKAGDRNCDVEPEHEYCNGTEGADGMVSCDLAGVERGACYDRDFSRIDCDEHSGHSRCGGTTGRNGLIFCDVVYADLGIKPSCYDRNDNPERYCDNYAVEESDFMYTARFCQGICENYEDVIGKGEPCN